MANTTRRNWQMPLQSTDRDLSVDQEQRSETAQGNRVSWGGIWSGVLVALGTLLLLSTLGLAVGIAAGSAAGGVSANGANGVSAGTVGTAAVIWSALSLLISMFLGGLASTRMGRIWDRGTGMFHGGLVWVLTLGAILYLGLRGLGSLMGSSSSMGIGSGAGSSFSGAAGSGAANTAAQHAPAIGWSPFIISALSLLAALAGAASGLRRLLDRGTGSSNYSSNYGSGSNYSSGTNYTGGSTTTGSDSTTTTTTTTRERDRDRY